MSIKVGNTNYKTTNNIDERLTLQSKTNTTLLELRPSINADINDVYIQLGNDIKIGSSNDIFVINSVENNNHLISITTDTLDISQTLNIDKVVIGSNELTSQYSSFSNEHNIYLNEYNFSVYYPNFKAFEISENTSILKNETFNIDANTHIYSNLYVNRILPYNNENILIDNLLLTNTSILDGVFKNQITIEQNILLDEQLVNNVSFGIYRYPSDCNFIELANFDDNIRNVKTIFDKDGHLGIGISANSKAFIHIENDTENLNFYSKGNSDFSIFNIDKLSRVGIGTDENKGLLHINRGDDLGEHDIRDEPLINLNIDYLEESNYISSNYVSTSNYIFNYDHLYIDIHSNIPEFGTNSIFIDFSLDKTLFVNNYTHFDFNKTPLLNNAIIDNSNTRINLQIRYIDQFFSTSNVILNEPQLIDENTITISNIVSFVDFSDPNLSSNINIYSCNIPFNVGDSNYNFNIEIQTNVYYSNIYTNFYYADHTPILVKPPPFCTFSSNQNTPFQVSHTGSLILCSNIYDYDNIDESLKFNLYGTGYATNLIIDNIIQDIDLNNNKLNNVGEVLVSNIQVYDNIVVGKFIFDSNGILNSETNKRIGDDIAEIDTADIANIDSTYFKYNDSRTNILNDFNICKNDFDIDSIRSKNVFSNTHLLCVSSKENAIIVTNDTYDINPTISIISSNTSNNEPTLKFYDLENNFSNTISMDYIEDDENSSTRFVLSSKNITTNGTDFKFLKYVNNMNALALGHGNMITIYDRTDNDITTSNTVCIGVPFSLISSEIVSLEQRQTFYVEQGIVSNKYNINIFGNSTINNMKNEPFISTYYDNISNYICMFDNASSQTDRKYKLRINGNLRCSTGGIVDADALFVEGPATVNGTLVTMEKIYAVGGVSSLSDRNLKTEMKVISNSLQKISELTGYTYLRKDTGKIETGLIAQDVEKVLPEVINKTKNGELTIDYGNMNGLIVEGLKALLKRIEKIENHIF